MIAIGTILMCINIVLSIITITIIAILAIRMKKVYKEINEIEKQVEGYIEEVISTEDDKIYQETQENQSNLISSVLREIFP